MVRLPMPGEPLISVEGPRFSRKLNQNTFRAWGMSIIGMTACPEVFLAREAEMCYVTMANVTRFMMSGGQPLNR